MTGVSLLLSQEHIKERRKQRQRVLLWIRKRDSKESNFSIINDLRLTDKEDFRKYRILKYNINEKYNFVSTFSIQWEMFIKMFFTTHACFCFCVMEFRKQKNIFCISESSLCFAQKNNFCITNKIKLVWFYSLYRNNFFEQKCKNVTFSYILKIFFTMLHLKIFQEYWIILYISRISLCVMSP